MTIDRRRLAALVCFGCTGVFMVGCSGDASGARGSTEGVPSANEALVRIHYPANGHVLGLTAGSVSVPLDETGANTWIGILEDVTGPVSFTPTLDERPAHGPAYVVGPGRVIDVYPSFDATKGTAARWDAFSSTIQGKTHRTRTYLPPSYAENTEKRYPVIYMHDGQIIFERNLGFADGVAKSEYGSFAVDTALDEGIANGRIPEAIVIGIDVRLEQDVDGRAQDYSPTRDDETVFGHLPDTGQGPLYLRSIALELKPVVDATFRTLADREHTFMIGASLGGTITVWAGLHAGDVFGSVASLSTAMYWDDEVLARESRAMRIGPTTATRIYVDVGQDERDGDASEIGAIMPSAEQQARLVAALGAAGYVEGQTLHAVVDPAGKHHGESWARRLPDVLVHLLGPGR